MDPLSSRRADLRTGLRGWLSGIRFRQVVSIPLWLLALALLVGGDVGPSFAPDTGSLSAVARAANLAQLMGIVVLLLAARLGASTAEQLRRLRPDRKPVLYLRSFSVDGNPLTSPSDEEILGRIFRTVGPFVAIGEPGELLPEIGSAKLFVPDDSWRQTVETEIRDAALVVLNVGPTPGFRWEMERVFELADPEKVVVYFSAGVGPEELRRLYEIFADVASGLLPHPLPDASTIRTERFVIFDDAWRPTVTGKVDPPDRAWRRVAGCLTLGLALPLLRPFVLYRRRVAVSRALSPLRARITGIEGQEVMMSRMATALSSYVLGLAAFFPALALNLYRAGRSRHALWALGATAIALTAPVRDATIFFGLLTAIAVYVGWPLLMPEVVRQQLAFGGPTVAWPIVASVVVGGALTEGLLPQGTRIPVPESDLAALLEVEEILPEVAHLGLGMEEGVGRARKRVQVNGSFDLQYVYESQDLALYSGVYRTMDVFEGLLGARAFEIPGAERIPGAQRRMGEWRISAERFMDPSGPLGDQVIATNGSLSVVVAVTGVVFEDPSALVLPLLDPALAVRGIWGT